MAFYKNHQWEVNDKFLETLQDGSADAYDIPREDIFQRLDDGSYKWPDQMSGKSWLDWPAFEAAFRSAVVHFSDAPNGPVDPVALEHSLNYGRVRWAVSFGDRGQP